MSMSPLSSAPATTPVPPSPSLRSALASPTCSTTCAMISARMKLSVNDFDPMRITGVAAAATAGAAASRIATIAAARLPRALTLQAPARSLRPGGLAHLGGQCLGTEELRHEGLGRPANEVREAPLLDETTT